MPNGKYIVKRFQVTRPAMYSSDPRVRAGVIEVRVDIDAIADQLARKVLFSKTGKSVHMFGAVKATRISFDETEK